MCGHDDRTCPEGITLNVKPAGLACYPFLIPLLALPALVIALGVVLPAVWSTKPARRRAAHAVLAQLLAALPRRGPPG
jgi:hypothetical protein